MLRLISLGRYHRLVELKEVLADEFSLTPEERCRKRQNGIDVIFYHNCCHAQTKLKKEGLIRYEKGTLPEITPAGKRALA